MDNDRRQRPTKDESRRTDEDAARRSSAPRDDDPMPQFGEDPGIIEPDSSPERR
jgi:hypothetical protein